MSRLTVIGSAILALGFVSTPAAFAQTSSDQPVVMTTGQASIDRAPDQAWVSIAAETRAASPGAAQRQAAEAMTAVQSALEKTGMPSDAIRTTGYSLRPDIQYDEGRARVRGYIASNRIEVRVDDLDRLGAVLDAAGGSGATNIAGLRFDVKDRASVEREALRLAVEDAMGRAEAMAAGAGATLGPIVRIDEQRMSPPRPMRTMEMTAARQDTPTPVTPGEIEISAQVTLTVQIR